MVKLKICPAVKKELDIISDLNQAVSGFMIGDKIGNFIIIKQILWIPINPDNLDEQYSKLIQAFGLNVRGVIFVNKEIVLNPWFLDDIIIVINRKKRDDYIYSITEFKLMSI